MAENQDRVSSDGLLMAHASDMLHWVVLGLLILGLLWAAYKIGKIVLRLAVGLAVLGLVGYALWLTLHS